MYSTFLGGSDLEWVRDLAKGPQGTAVVTGYTGSPDFPTTQGVYSPDYIGGQLDAFLTKLSMQYEGVTTLGSSTPSCLGEVRLGLLKQPAAIEPGFGFYGSGVPPDSFGVLLLGLHAQESAFLGAGAGLWIDPQGRTAVVPVMSDPYGYMEVPVALVPALSGRDIFAQVVMASTADCSNGERWAASPALAIRVQ